MTYNDGDKEDYTYDELFRIRAHRPTRPMNPHARQFCALELFCGCAAVSHEFLDRKWRVRCLDNDMEHSNATDVVDVMKVQYDNIGFVPDFIWCSPPCFTYSNLAGGKHRSPSTGEFAKTPEAHEHDRIFIQMAAILTFFKKKNPRLIVVIENPRGLLAKMPLMHALEEEFPLRKAEVDYCQFGRDDKKPTDLWTNVSFSFATYLFIENPANKKNFDHN